MVSTPWRPYPRLLMIVPERGANMRVRDATLMRCVHVELLAIQYDNQDSHIYSIRNRNHMFPTEERKTTYEQTNTKYGPGT